MNILKLKRIFYLFITLAAVGILVTSCEKEIIGSEEDGLKEIIIEDKIPEVSDPLSNNKLGCREQCSSFYQWLNQQDAAAAQSQHNNCVNGDPIHDEACADAAIEYLIQAQASNTQWYNNCIADCPPAGPGPSPIGPIQPFSNGAVVK